MSRSRRTRKGRSCSMMEMMMPYTSAEQHPAPFLTFFLARRAGTSPLWSRRALVAVRTSENCIRLKDHMPRTDMHKRGSYFTCKRQEQTCGLNVSISPAETCVLINTRSSPDEEEVLQLTFVLHLTSVSINLRTSPNRNHKKKSVKFRNSPDGHGHKCLNQPSYFT